MSEILSWNIWEVSSEKDSIHGVMFRGRIRKFCLENDITCLVENASDKENTVRFALLEDVDPKPVSEFVLSITPDVEIAKLDGQFKNPVLSKVKVNDESRYSI